MTHDFMGAFFAHFFGEIFRAFFRVGVAVLVANFPCGRNFLGRLIGVYFRA